MHYPEIDIFLPNCGEDIAVIANTVKYVTRIRWKGKLNVWMLDDAGRSDLEVLCQLNNINYLSRPNKGELKKAGNLRYAFGQTTAPFFVVFDADFCPREDFLEELFPYFHWDEKIAIIQSPQYFRVNKNQAWVEAGAGYVQQFFYRLVEVNRDHFGAPICVGTNAIYRRAALEPFGGTAAIGYSEDLHTGFSVMSTGWKVKFVPINLATGTCPETFSSFFFQQYRWCMGSTSLLFNSEFWHTRMRLTHRLSYLSGMFYYICTAVSIPIAPLPSILSVWFFPQEVELVNFLFVLPSFLFINLAMPMWTRARWGFYVPAIRLVTYYAHASALMSRITKVRVPWVATGSGDAAKAKLKPYRQFKWCLGLWTIAQIALVFSGAFTHSTTHWVDAQFLPNLALTLFHAFIAGLVFWHDRPSAISTTPTPLKTVQSSTSA